MRITLLTQPGRGDAEPFVALAVRLSHEGHQVKVATRPDLEGLVTGNGIEFAPVGHPYQPFIAGAAKAGALGPGHPIKQVRYGIGQRRYVSDNLQDDAWRAAQGAEAIIYKYPWVTAHTIAEKLRIPSAPVMLLPFLPTAAFPSFVTGRGLDRGRFVNQLVWKLPWQAIWSGLRLDDRKLRRKLGLPALPVRAPNPLRETNHTPVFCAWSDAVLPKPSDWPDHVEVTGYWFLDQAPGWQPPARLVNFLADGPPPVSIGFGSMVSADPAATMHTVLDALELSGQRGILLSGWGGIAEPGPLPRQVVLADSVPHSWLFSRVAAAVHHGGAGTTAAALRAGIPAVITPVLADQPSWARTVHELGAGPAPIPFQQLSASRLADAIRTAVTTPSIRQRANEIGKRLQAEDGLGRTIDLFTNYLQRYHHDPPH